MYGLSMNISNGACYNAIDESSRSNDCNVICKRSGNLDSEYIWINADGTKKFPGRRDTIIIPAGVEMVITRTVSFRKIIVFGTLVIHASVGVDAIYSVGKISGQGELVLFTDDNFIKGADSFSLSVVSYYSRQHQRILPLFYNTLRLDYGTKILIGDLYAKTVTSSASFTNTAALAFLNADGYNIHITHNPDLQINLYKGNYGKFSFGGGVPGRDVYFLKNIHLYPASSRFGVDFSAGNVDIDFMASLRLEGYGAVKTGTGIWRFHSHNLAIIVYTNFSPGTVKLDCQIIIDGITLSFITPETAFRPHTFVCTNSVQGTTSDSKLFLMREMTLDYKHFECPMLLGQILAEDRSTVAYSGGNQEVKGATYSNLILSGGGIKKLMGDVIVTKNYTISVGTTLDLNGFSLVTL